MSDNAEIPSSPDYSPIIAALQNSASLSAKNGADALDWAKQQFAGNADLRDKVNAGLLDTQAKAQARADRNDATSENLLGTGEQKLLDNVNRYTDPSRVAADMGAAQANVAQQFDGARTAATRELEGFGVDPSSTRYGALDIGVRAQQAAAAAGAGTMASRADDALAAQAVDKVVNQGNIRAGTVNPTAATGASAGAGALNGALATTASGQSGIGTDLAWTGAGNGALTSSAGTMGQSYSDALNAAKAKNAQSSGIGSLLGTVAGLGKDSLGGSALSSLGTSAMAFLEDGGMMPDATTGGAVPIEASPSRGAETDDVNAKINAGEFVFPKDAASWWGEQKLQKMIEQAREQKSKATAKPTVSAVPTGPAPPSPAFQSRPVQGAVPMG